MASDSLAKSVICLTLFVVINAVAFVVVTVIQCNNIRDLEVADADLESDFDDIFYKVEFGSDDFQRALVKAVPSGVRTKRSGLGDIFMDLLKTQESVIEAHCKDTTKICKQGDKGDAGPSGDQGLKGNHGTAGTKGARGYQGIQGIKGRHGLPGNVGANGTTGATGPQGPAGPIGQKGDPGTKGLVGPKGEPGISGVNGTKGEPGNPGLPGQAGLKGNQGTKGARGERGIPGIKGIRGGPGQKGADRDKLKVGCECLKQPTIAGPENEVRHVVYGSSATMTCNADGIPPPKITWNTKAVGSTLTVPRVTSFDYRTYQCTASNVFGTDTKNITLAN